MKPAGRELDREVCRALKEYFSVDPHWSTDPAHVGPLLVEAEMRGWEPQLRQDIGRGWRLFLTIIHPPESTSLPEAVAKAFVLAAWAAKGGA